MNYCNKCRHCLSFDFYECPNCGYRPKIIDNIPIHAPNLAFENDGFNTKDHAYLIEVEAGYFWFEHRNKILLWVLQKYFPMMVRFCEVGCGTGFVLQEISKSFPFVELFASDIYLNALSYVKTRVTNARLFQADLNQFPYVGKFNVVGAFDVIEHIDDDIGVLDNIYRSLKPGGGVILTVPQHRWLWSKQDVLGCHKRRYSRKELVNKMDSAGFNVVTITSFISLLLPLMIVSRLISQKDGYLKCEAEFNLPIILNKILLLITGIERILIKAGIDLPLGGSLLVVGRKKE